MVSITTQKKFKQIQLRSGKVVGDLSKDTARKKPSYTNPTPLGTSNKQTKGILQLEKLVATLKNLCKRCQTKSHKKQ
jgi:hypothetical protein